MTKRDTNRTFAANDTSFHEACKLAGVEATPRQASKFRNKKGAAYAALKKSVRGV